MYSNCIKYAIYDYIYNVFTFKLLERLVRVFNYALFGKYLNSSEPLRFLGNNNFTVSHVSFLSESAVRWGSLLLLCGWTADCCRTRHEKHPHHTLSPFFHNVNLALSFSLCKKQRVPQGAEGIITAQWKDVLYLDWIWNGKHFILGFHEGYHFTLTQTNQSLAAKCQQFAFACWNDWWSESVLVVVFVICNWSKCL